MTWYWAWAAAALGSHAARRRRRARARMARLDRGGKSSSFPSIGESEPIVERRSIERQPQRHGAEPRRSRRRYQTRQNLIPFSLCPPCSSVPPWLPFRLSSEVLSDRVLEEKPEMAAVEIRRRPQAAVRFEELRVGAEELDADGEGRRKAHAQARSPKLEVRRRRRRGAWTTEASSRAMSPSRNLASRPTFRIFWSSTSSIA